MESAKLHPEFVIDENGSKKAVIIPFNEYREFMEDYYDLLDIAKRRHEPSIPHAQVMEELKRDGLI